MQFKTIKLTYAIEISVYVPCILESLVSKRNLSGHFIAEYGEVSLMPRTGVKN